MAVGTVVIVSDSGGRGSPRKIVLDCTSDASGVVTSDELVASLTGEFQSAETDPDGTDVPTSYNFQVRRGAATGFDLLGGNGASRSTTAIERCTPEDGNGNAALEPVREDSIFFTADAVGNAKKFRATLYFLQWDK